MTENHEKVKEWNMDEKMSENKVIKRNNIELADNKPADKDELAAKNRKEFVQQNKFPRTYPTSIPTSMDDLMGWTGKRDPNMHYYNQKVDENSSTFSSDILKRFAQGYEIVYRDDVSASVGGQSGYKEYDFKPSMLDGAVTWKSGSDGRYVLMQIPKDVWEEQQRNKRIKKKELLHKMLRPSREDGQWGFEDNPQKQMAAMQTQLMQQDELIRNQSDIINQIKRQLEAQKT